MKLKPWHDRMTILWVTPETKKAIQSLRDPRLKLKTADDVIDMLFQTFMAHMQQCNLSDIKPTKGKE